MGLARRLSNTISKVTSTTGIQVTGHATLAGKDAGASPASSLNNAIDHLTIKNAGIQLTRVATLTAEGSVPAGAAAAVMAGSPEASTLSPAVKLLAVVLPGPSATSSAS